MKRFIPFFFSAYSDLDFINLVSYSNLGTNEQCLKACEGVWKQTIRNGNNKGSRQHKNGRLSE